jgi:hypothetical protein
MHLYFDDRPSTFRRILCRCADPCISSLNSPFRRVRSWLHFDPFWRVLRALFQIHFAVPQIQNGMKKKTIDINASINSRRGSESVQVSTCQARTRQRVGAGVHLPALDEAQRLLYRR